MQRVKEDWFGSEGKWWAHFWPFDLKELEGLNLKISRNLLEMWDWALAGREISTRNIHPEIIWIMHIMETIGVSCLKEPLENTEEKIMSWTWVTPICEDIEKRGHQEGKDEEVRIKQMWCSITGAINEEHFKKDESAEAARLQGHQREWGRWIRAHWTQQLFILIPLTNILEHLFCFRPCDRHL